MASLPCKRYTSCERKRVFADEDSATDALRHLQQRDRSWLLCRVYPCEFASHFHLGHPIGGSLGWGDVVEVQ